jgi:hypothetical protein
MTTTGEIWLGMQPDEDKATADCGCTLFRTGVMNDDPYYEQCLVHSLTPEMVAALRTIAALQTIPDGTRRMAAIAEDLLARIPLPACQPLTPDMTLSTGRTIQHAYLTNGAQHANPADGGTLTEAEWEEYCRRRRIASHILPTG